jgi:hypothetical protein
MQMREYLNTKDRERRTPELPRRTERSFQDEHKAASEQPKPGESLADVAQRVYAPEVCRISRPVLLETVSHLRKILNDIKHARVEVYYDASLPLEQASLTNANSVIRALSGKAAEALALIDKELER